MSAKNCVESAATLTATAGGGGSSAECERGARARTRVIGGRRVARLSSLGARSPPPPPAAACQQTDTRALKMRAIARRPPARAVRSGQRANARATRRRCLSYTCACSCARARARAFARCACASTVLGVRRDNLRSRASRKFAHVRRRRSHRLRLQ